MASASPDSSNCSNVLATTTLLKSSLGSVTKIIYHYKHIKLKHIDHNCCNLYYFVCVFFILWFFRPKMADCSPGWRWTHPYTPGFRADDMDECCLRIYRNFRTCQNVSGRLHCIDISSSTQFSQLIPSFCFIINDFPSSLCHSELNSLFSPVCYTELNAKTTVSNFQLPKLSPTVSEDNFRSRC